MAASQTRSNSAREMVLDKVAGVGIRQQQILVADQSREVATSGERVHAAWQLRRSRAIADGSRPSAIVRSVTEVAHDPSGNRAALRPRQ